MDETQQYLAEEVTLIINVTSPTDVENVSNETNQIPDSDLGFGAMTGVDISEVGAISKRKRPSQVSLNEFLKATEEMCNKINEVGYDYCVYRPSGKGDKCTCTQTCIDNFDIQIKIKDNVIEDIRFDGEACAIATSSLSIAISKLIGKKKDEALNIIENYNKNVLEKIVKASKDLEIEIFVHGALCVSYSGCCPRRWCDGYT